MKVYFLRHGIAEDPEPGQPDRMRRLTPEGIEEMRAVGRGMAALDLRLTAIYSSPLVRAWQTAEIAAASLGAETLLAEEDRLACGCAYGDLASMLAGQPEKARVLLVGHEPDMSDLVRSLTGAYVRMKKASLAYVDWPKPMPGCGELRWLLEADHLAAIGRGAPGPA